MKITRVLIWMIVAPLVSAQETNLSDSQHFLQQDAEVIILFALGLAGSNTDNSLPFGSDRDEFYFQISLAAGFYILDGLSIEPEIEYNFLPEDVEYSLIGNLWYMFYIPPKNIYPFIKMGYAKILYAHLCFMKMKIKYRLYNLSLRL